jgi:hypothetical protein
MFTRADEQVGETAVIMRSDRSIRSLRFCLPPCSPTVPARHLVRQLPLYLYAGELYSNPRQRFLREKQRQTTGTHHSLISPHTRRFCKVSEVFRGDTYEVIIGRTAHGPLYKTGVPAQYLGKLEQQVI